MGQFKFEIIAVGGHGCSRETKDGQQKQPCRRMGCPDCEAQRLVDILKGQGNQIESAKLTHWPGTENEVVDDLLTGERMGSF